MLAEVVSRDAPEVLAQRAIDAYLHLAATRRAAHEAVADHRTSFQHFGHRRGPLLPRGTQM